MVRLFLKQETSLTKVKSSELDNFVDTHRTGSLSCIMKISQRHILTTLRNTSSIVHVQVVLDYSRYSWIKHHSVPK